MNSIITQSQRPSLRSLGGSMELKHAEEIAGEIIQALQPHCQKIEVAGSIRRKKPYVHDIDIVLVPANQGALLVALNALGSRVKEGPAIMQRQYKGVMVDFYFATPETWYTLLLIRTGSKEHNIRLTTLAKRRGWHLHASGKGLTNEQGERLAGESEESFFAALGIPFVATERI